ncbi:MaoC/PaaZ C-terminal domain-containing protein [Nocardia brasiliensis]|uniref:MaoC/PaaZ C-terminal domain-containing protein n=1 Tax=Nocardia brasiliensis TaxID=37326 RepID=UPI003D91DC8F
MSSSTEQLSNKPRIGELYLRAFVGALPVPVLNTRPRALPNTKLTLAGARVRRNELDRYRAACGLTDSGALPLTYLSVLANPVAMRLMVARDFPFALPGLVHLRNVIEQRRPLRGDELLDITVHAADLRDHRRGKVFDLISEVSIAGEPVWKQTATLLKPQKRPARPRPDGRGDDAQAPSGAPLRVDQRTVNRYAAASGDYNPIHVSGIGARILGFPGPIAHGMWQAAAVLGSIPGEIPAACAYDVTFGKPMIVPGEARLAVERTNDGSGWYLSLRHAGKGFAHLTASLTPR